MTVTVVQLLILIGIPIVLILDVYLAVDKRTGNTYSEILRSWFTYRAWLYYLTAFAIGVLMGHWAPK